MNADPKLDSLLAEIHSEHEQPISPSIATGMPVPHHCTPVFTQCPMCGQCHPTDDVTAGRCTPVE